LDEIVHIRHDMNYRYDDCFMYFIQRRIKMS